MFHRTLLPSDAESEAKMPDIHAVSNTDQTLDLAMSNVIHSGVGPIASSSSLLRPLPYIQSTASASSLSSESYTSTHLQLRQLQATTLVQRPSLHPTAAKVSTENDADISDSELDAELTALLDDLKCPEVDSRKNRIRSKAAGRMTKLRNRTVRPRTPSKGASMSTTTTSSFSSVDTPPDQWPYKEENMSFAGKCFSMHSKLKCLSCDELQGLLVLLVFDVMSLCKMFKLKTHR